MVIRCDLICDYYCICCIFGLIWGDFVLNCVSKEILVFYFSFLLVVGLFC